MHFAHPMTSTARRVVNLVMLNFCLHTAAFLLNHLIILDDYQTRKKKKEKKKLLRENKRQLMMSRQPHDGRIIWSEAICEGFQV